MLELSPVLSEKIWGYEHWIASTHPDGKQQNFADAIKGDYPLLVKVIQANEKLSIQVHPDDDAAARLENDPRGKTECWYILSAEKGATLVYGLNKTYTEDELRKAILANKLEGCLNTVEVHAGDFIYIPAGTVHAIGGGLRLLEVQQSSNVTYRLYDWGRGRELHIDKGLQVIKNDGAQKVVPFPKDFDCKYFTLSEIDVSGGYSFFATKGSNVYDWQLVFIIEGTGLIKSTEQKQIIPFKAESIFAVAPGEKITVEGKNIKIMRIICKKEA